MPDTPLVCPINACCAPCAAGACIWRPQAQWARCGGARTRAVRAQPRGEAPPSRPSRCSRCAAALVVQATAARATRPNGARQRDAPRAAARDRASCERSRVDLGAAAPAQPRAALPPSSRCTAALLVQNGGRARGARGPRRRRGREKLQRCPARTSASATITCEIGVGSECANASGVWATHASLVPPHYKRP